MHRAAQEEFIFDGFTDDDFAGQLGELTVESATCAEDRVLTAFDDNAPEEMVSPFSVAYDVEEDEPEG